MRSILLATTVALGLLVAQLASVIDSQRAKLHLTLRTVATAIAHEFIDTEHRQVVGNVTVQPVGGTRYRARGTACSSAASSGPCIVHWTFTFDIDLPPLTSDLAIEPNHTDDTGQ